MTANGFVMPHQDVESWRNLGPVEWGRFVRNVDPADVRHVPRWLDEAQYAEAKAGHCLAHPTSPLAVVSPEPATDPNHARWLDG